MPQKTILVIEDDVDALALYRDQLEDEGYRVFPSESGVMAMLILDREKVDLILTDIKMPDVDVKYLLSHLNLHFPRIPILIATAYPDYESLKDNHKNVKGFFVKPVNMVELCETIKALIKNHSS